MLQKYYLCYDLFIKHFIINNELPSRTSELVPKVNNNNGHFYSANTKSSKKITEQNKSVMENADKTFTV